MVQKAIDFATKVHEGQYRKGTDRPYIVHPMEVGKIVSTMTQDEEIPNERQSNDRMVL